MAQKFPGSWNNCATCSFWTGAREVDFFGQWVTVEQRTSAGRCACRASGWGRIEKEAWMSCSHYDKWGPVKK